MKQVYFILFVGCFLFAPSVKAQDFDDLGRFEEGWLKLAYRYTSLSGKYTKTLSGSSFDVSFRSDKVDPWALRYSFEYPVLGDLIVNLGKEIKNFNKGTNNVETVGFYQTLTSGWIGWHKLAINAVAKDRFLLSPGISFGDHMLATETWEQSAGKKILEPSGYYFFAGPYLMASYVITDFMWVDAYMNYDITFTKAGNPGKGYDKKEYPNYPLPTLFFIGANVYTDFGPFAGIKIGKMKDSGLIKNAGSRVDFTLGYNF